MKIVKLPINKLKLNEQNPRFIKDDDYQKLLASIKDFPEMAEVREVIINKDYIILGGNMRFRAMKEAGWKEIPVRIVDWPEDKQREFVIKDNISGGDWDWDILANQWDAELLTEWGLDLPDYHSVNNDDFSEIEGLDEVIKNNQDWQLFITFKSEDDMKDFINKNEINLKDNFKRTNNTISINWPLEGKMDIKNVRFE